MIYSTTVVGVILRDLLYDRCRSNFYVLNSTTVVGVIITNVTEAGRTVNVGWWAMGDGRRWSHHSRKMG